MAWPLPSWCSAENGVMDKSTNDETITFYDVPLVCGAAPEIGCGSRAKPLLIDLEQQIGIKEAWLNRTGTIVAIAWRASARTEEVVQPVFERHPIHYSERRTKNQPHKPLPTDPACSPPTHLHHPTPKQ